MENRNKKYQCTGPELLFSVLVAFFAIIFLFSLL